MMDITEAVSRLEGVLASDQLAQRDAARCEKLAEALRRPARICLIGAPGIDLPAIVTTGLGQDAETLRDLPAVFEISGGPSHRFEARLSNGDRIAGQDWPPDGLEAAAPVFLRLEYPLAALDRMSFLALQLDPDPAQQRPALAWAAQRSDIGVLCVKRYDMDASRIWNSSADSLREHAYLLECDAKGHAAAPNPYPEFIAQFRPSAEDADTGVTSLMRRLSRDVSDARMADMDATRLFLHRLGLDAVPSTPTPPPAHDATDPAALLPLLSEPLIYLIGRAKALSQDLAWMTEEEAWAQHVLTECTETAEDLCDRMMLWSDDDPVATRLQRRAEAMRDTMTLLQFEDGDDAARQAAALIEQMRSEIEQALKPSGPS
ncbi:MAG: hypothetical protein AAF376_07690 [Pseudomonadota bacterium]